MGSQLWERGTANLTLWMKTLRVQEVAVSRPPRQRGRGQDSQLGPPNRKACSDPPDHRAKPAIAIGVWGSRGSSLSV